MAIRFEKIEGRSLMFYLWSFLLTALVLGGAYATYLLNEYGMFLSGMTNRIAWGIQAVLADYYIGMAVGCIVIAVLYDAVGKMEYRSFSRIAVFLALLFSVAALLSIMANQGRLDRFLTRSFIHFNPSSLSSLQAFFYSTFGLICCVFLYALYTEKHKLGKTVSLIGILWAIVLHSRTGYIFGLLPRNLYESPLAPPTFIAAAAASGIAVFIIVTVVLFKLIKRNLNCGPLLRTGRVLSIVLIASLCLVAAENIFRIIQTETRHAAFFFLFSGFHSLPFWLGWVLLGCIFPVSILFRKKITISKVVLASVLVAVGVLCECWLLVLPGLMFPPDLFSGWEIVAESTVTPEGIVGYSFSFPELAQAFGIFGLIGLLFLWGMKFLELVPKETEVPQ